MEDHQKDASSNESDLRRKAEELKKKEQQKRDSLISYNDLRFSISRGY